MLDHVRLVFDESLAHDLIDGGFDEARRDVFPVSVAVPIVRYERFVHDDLMLELVECVEQLSLRLAFLYNLDIGR